MSGTSERVGGRIEARAPERVCDARGEVVPGTYVGAPGDTSLEERCRSRLKRIKREKRWCWWGVMDREVAMGSAIIELGYVSQGFVWLFDRRSGEFLVDEEYTKSPGAATVSNAPFARAVASFACGKDRWGVARTSTSPGAGCTLRGRAAQLAWDIDLVAPEEGAPAITAIFAGRERAHVNTTVKQVGLSARGSISFGARRFELTGEAQGLVDYTHGLLERETYWRWAIGAGVSEGGESIGFNAVSHFNDGLENVVWIGGEPHALGQVEIDWDEDNARWLMTGEETRLELMVEGTRRADKDLVVAASRYRQPIGAWQGVLAGVRVARLWGVAEEHLAKW